MNEANGPSPQPNLSTLELAVFEPAEILFIEGYRFQGNVEYEFTLRFQHPLRPSHSRIYSTQSMKPFTEETKFWLLANFKKQLESEILVSELKMAAVKQYNTLKRYCDRKKFYFQFLEPLSYFRPDKIFSDFGHNVANASKLPNAAIQSERLGAPDQSPIADMALGDSGRKHDHKTNPDHSMARKVAMRVRPTDDYLIALRKREALNSCDEDQHLISTPNADRTAFGSFISIQGSSLSATSKRIKMTTSGVTTESNTKKIDNLLKMIAKNKKMLEEIPEEQLIGEKATEIFVKISDAIRKF
jgi:hypothetical protein